MKFWIQSQPASSSHLQRSCKLSTKNKRGRPAKVMLDTIVQSKRQRGRPSKACQIDLFEKKDNTEKIRETRGCSSKALSDEVDIDQIERPRGSSSKTNQGSLIEDSSDDSIDGEEEEYDEELSEKIKSQSEEDENDSETLSELRIIGKGNILSKVFIDESLTCDAPVETHMFDVLVELGRPLPCYYCGENSQTNIVSTLSQEKFPLCRKCEAAGRGAASRRKSRQIKPKALKTKKPESNKKSKKRKSSLIDELS